MSHDASSGSHRASCSLAARYSPPRRLVASSPRRPIQCIDYRSTAGRLGRRPCWKKTRQAALTWRWTRPRFAASCTRRRSGSEQRTKRISRRLGGNSLLVPRVNLPVRLPKALREMANTFRRQSSAARPPPLIPGIRPKAPWWRQVHPAYWALPLLSFVTILAAPPNVLDQFPALRAFCAQMIAWLPFLGKHAVGSSMPQLVTAVKCVSFALIPVALVLPFLLLWHERAQILQERLASGERPPKSVEATFLGAAAIAALGHWILPGDPSWCAGCGTGSSLAMAVLTSSAIGIIGLSALTVASCIYIRLGFWLAATKDKK